MFKTEIIGNLTKKPELRKNADGKVYTFIAVAINLSKDKSEFIDCLFGGATAENICKYLDKGSKVFVRGTFNFEKREGQDKEGHKGYYLTRWTLTGDTIEFLSPKPASTSSGPVEEISADDDLLPF